MPVRDEEIDPPVVIVIKKLCSPSDIGHADRRHIRFVGHIAERVLAVVVIESIVLISEVRLEEIEFPVVIVIPDRYPHTPLLAPVTVDRRAGDETDLFEGAV